MSTASERLLEQFKALSDPHRLRLMALCQYGELSVSELTSVLGQSQPRVSQHLKQLCDAGLLRRFRDGKRVYYRVAADGSAAQRRLLALIPAEDQPFADDAQRLRTLRSAELSARPVPLNAEPNADAERRAVYRALLEHSMAAPVGDLLDIGCGRGDILKLMATRARRAIGVDIDADARGLARAELLLAGLNNCSLRKGDMYRLPFDEQSFDTIVLDDVLGTAERPLDVLLEAARVLRADGRILTLCNLKAREASAVQSELADSCAAAGLRLAAPRLIPPASPRWMVAVATRRAVLADDSAAA